MPPVIYNLLIELLGLGWRKLTVAGGVSIPSYTEDAPVNRNISQPEAGFKSAARVAIRRIGVA